MLTDNKKKNMERPKSYDILEADPDISIKGGGNVEKGLQHNFTGIRRLGPLFPVDSPPPSPFFPHKVEFH